MDSGSDYGSEATEEESGPESGGRLRGFEAVLRAQKADRRPTQVSTKGPRRERERLMAKKALETCLFLIVHF